MATATLIPNTYDTVARVITDAADTVGNLPEYQYPVSEHDIIRACFTVASQHLAGLSLNDMVNQCRDHLNLFAISYTTATSTHDWLLSPRNGREVSDFMRDASLWRSETN